MLLCLIQSSFASVQLEHVPEQWLHLLRYNKNLWGGIESEVDSKNFFLAKSGKTDPASELAANIENFRIPIENFKDPNQHPVCLFPGRYLFLKNIGKVRTEFDLDKCSDFKTFKDKLELSSVSVVFSSYFINKPASAFGHTFFKLNKDSPLKTDLQSYGVDFSAQVTTKNPIAYGVLGIFGGFYGKFNLMPYFLKLREYNDYESRDLWEFELNLNDDELDLFTAHLWDMNQAAFDYFYFSENCSYHISRFIDAVKPDWKIMEAIYETTIPIDTLVPLKDQKNITQDIYFRPSQQKRSQQKLEKLNDIERRAVKNSFNNLKLAELGDFNRNQKAKILDAIIDFTDYKYPTQMHLSKDNPIQDFKREALIARSQIEVTSQSIEKFQVEEFDSGHKARKFGLGARGGDRTGMEFRHRFALHDILEPQGDVYSLFSLEMGKTRFFLERETNKFIFEELEVAHVEALRPINFLEKRISWNFDFGLKNRFEIVAPFLNIGVGPSLAIGKQNFTLFFQTENNHLFNEYLYQQSYLGANFQWLFKKDNFGFKVNFKKYRDLVLAQDNVDIVQSELSYLPSKNYQIAAETSKSDLEERASLLIYAYY